MLGALLNTAERATRLLAMGEGSAKGTRPTWLARSIDLTVTGLSQGSTILEIDAPRIADVAAEAFEQKDFWRETPGAEDTALDLAALAIQEVERGDSATIEGLVHFKLNGQPRFIEARKISPPAAGDEIFANRPMVPARLSQDSLFPELAQRSRDADPMSLWGAWPGDEPIEELLAMLD